MATIAMPAFGVAGTVKKPLRMKKDFDKNELANTIELRGYRLVWTRASVCPCAGVNDKTQQRDPNCTLCKGTGWIYFGPINYEPTRTTAGELTALQTHVVKRDGGAVIRGIMSGLENSPEYRDKLGMWAFGKSMVTVRPENRLGYYDRLISLDSIIVYSEVVKVLDPTQPLTLRYPVLGVNYLRTVEKVFTTADFTLNDDGQVVWYRGRGPASGVNLAAHYLTFPCWIITDHPKSTRDSFTDRKVPVRKTPAGDPINLPVQAVVQYDFLQG